MDIKHTPGPWVYHDGDEWVYDMDGKSVCKVVWNGEDNRPLITAAPELLEALKECADRLEIHIKHSEDLVAHMRALAVIRKATGGD